ncbi:MAG: hypothetical protein AVDCRST_MAG89-789, partial [uncultured Gemmatimonadetes bacterium]
EQSHPPRPARRRAVGRRVRPPRRAGARGRPVRAARGVGREALRGRDEDALAQPHHHPPHRRAPAPRPLHRGEAPGAAALLAGRRNAGQRQAQAALGRRPVSPVRGGGRKRGRGAPHPVRGQLQHAVRSHRAPSGRGGGQLRGGGALRRAAPQPGPADPLAGPPLQDPGGPHRHAPRLRRDAVPRPRAVRRDPALPRDGRGGAL